MPIVRIDLVHVGDLYKSDQLDTWLCEHALARVFPVVADRPEKVTLTIGLNCQGARICWRVEHGVIVFWANGTLTHHFVYAEKAFEFAEWRMGTFQRISLEVAR